MPCVLPVIGIKILSFSQSNEGSRKNAILRSGVFSAGIISVFLILATLASFAKFSWGEQFQNPFMLIGIIVLIVLFALWMFEIFMFTVPGSVSSLERKSGDGLVGDFFRGVFATILATPCSGPFLGATLAWAFTQTSLVIFMVFVSIGVGMAFPYILLSSSKTLTRLIPKPGKWMIDFKNLMGFILIGFAVYLLIGLPRDMIVSAVGICVISVFAATFYTRLAPWGVSTIARKLISALAAIVIASAGIYFCINVLYKSMSEQVAENVTEQGQWVDFSADLLKKAHSERRNVVIDFTANWCMNCQYNKIVVLNSKPVKELIADRNILTIKADLTRPNLEIEALMHMLGSRSVPFLAVFPGDDPYKPIVMRDILNQRDLERVVKALPGK
jgi:thiol:disulfide interchange protein DsbD